MKITHENASRQPDGGFPDYESDVPPPQTPLLPDGWSRDLPVGDSAWVASYTHRSPAARRLVGLMVLGDLADDDLIDFARRLRPVLLRLHRREVGHG